MSPGGRRAAALVGFLIAAQLPPVAARLARAGCDLPATCSAVSGACSASLACPPGYTCVAGECRGAACAVTADCPAGGDCVDALGAGGPTCVCGGCAPWRCRLGCVLGVLSGCRCESLADCPPEDDVCFRGVCS